LFGIVAAARVAECNMHKHSPPLTSKKNKKHNNKRVADLVVSNFIMGEIATFFRGHEASISF